MKKDNKQTSPSVKKNGKVKRKGVHSKKKNSNLKTSKNYKKSYCGQG